MQILHLLHVTSEVLGTALVMFNDDNHNVMTLGDASTFTRVMSGCMSFVISRKHQQILILTIVILQRNEKKIHVKLTVYTVKRLTPYRVTLEMKTSVFNKKQIEISH